MPAADSTRADAAPKFRSPKRTLARAFRLSRNRWKAKASQRRLEIKALKIRIRDLEISRELWKEKSLHLQRQLDEFLGLVPPLQEEEPDPAALTSVIPPACLNDPDDVTSGGPALTVFASVPDQPPLPQTASPVLAQLPLTEAESSLDQPPLAETDAASVPEQLPLTPAAAHTAPVVPPVPPQPPTEASGAKKKRSRARR